MKKILSRVIIFYLMFIAAILNATGADNCNIPPSSAIAVNTTPVIEITNPENGEVFDTSSISISGTLTSSATVTINGVPASAGSNSFSANGVAIFPGLNTITAVATDPDGRVSRHSIQVWLLGDVNLEGAQPSTKSASGSFVHEIEEDDPLKLMVLVNDDNDDGDPPGSPSPMDNDDTTIHTDDNDIVTLRLKKLPPAINTGILELRVTSGNTDVRIFNTSGSGVLADWSVNLASPTGELAGLATGDLDLYLEGLNPNTDVTIELVYIDTNGTELCSDEVHLFVFEIDSVILTENAQPVNRAVIRPPFEEIPNLLYFHDCPTSGNETRGSSSLQLVASSSSAELFADYDKLESTREDNIEKGKFGASPVSKTLTHYDDTEGDTSPDYQIKVGIDSDKDETLTDKEPLGKFYLHLVTEDNYTDSITEIDVLLFIGLNDGSDALYRRLITGSFSGADTDFIPVPVAGGIIVRGNENSNTAVSDHIFTHNLGANFTGTGSNAVATVPLFEWPLGSDGSANASAQSDYRDQVVAYLESLAPTQIQTMFGAGAVGTTVSNVVINNVSLLMDLGIIEVGVAHVTGTGYIEFDITREATKTYKIHDVRSVLTFEDLMDFNFFNSSWAGWTGFPQAGASVQAGFGKCGHAAGVGEIFVIRIYTDESFSSSPISVYKVVP